MAPAISSADRLAVPLNTRCSIRWEIPPRLSGSTREPVSTQIPTATERTWGMASVTTRMPFGSRSFRQATSTLGGGLRPPSEPSPQDAVRAAGRRGAGAPPSEASNPDIRAAGRRGAGAPPSEASNPDIRAAGRRGAGAPPSAASNPERLRRQSRRSNVEHLGRAFSPARSLGATSAWRDGQLLSLGPGRLLSERALAREPDLAVGVDLDDLDRHRVALGEDVGHRPDPVLGDLGDVEQPLGAGHDLDEGAELLDALHLAQVDTVQLRLAADVLDDVHCHLRRVAAGGEDRDLAVVLHVDLGAGLLLDAADHLAAGPDDLADLLGPDLDGNEARGIGAHLRPGRLDRLRHLPEDVQASGARLGQGPAHDVDGNAGDLDVHLEGGDALVGARHLEVHVPVVVLGAHDVGEDADLVAFLDQPHGDTRNR